MRESEKKRLVFVVTEDWYFYSHRLPMVRAAREAGFDVHVITNIKDHESRIIDAGVTPHHLSFARKSLNPFIAMKQLYALSKLYREIKPAIAHHIAMKPILIGSMAALWTRVPAVINAFAGLGYVFNARQGLALMIRILLWLPFFFLLRRKNSFLLFQNRDDKKTLQKAGFVVEERCRIIRGSGVDLNQYPVIERPPVKQGQPVLCAFAGRMIGIKGLDTLQKAFQILSMRRVNAHLNLYGAPDLENPGSWTLERLQSWDSESDNVTYCGQSDNMPDNWGRTDIAIQASYGGEGVPKSLLEAASCGCAIVATDVPGCREVVMNGENGYLVPPYDEKALADAIEKMAGNTQGLREMGLASRKMVESDLSAEQVQKQTASLYNEVLDYLSAQKRMSDPA